MRAVLERDYSAQAVRPRAFAARTAVAVWAAAALVVLALGGIAAGSDFDRVGRGAFRATTTALFVFLCTTLPFLFTGSLYAERRQNTLALVLASPEGPRGLVLGKFLSRLGTVLGWTLAALPPLTVAVLFGGTPWHALVNSALGLVATAVELACWGLLVSSLASRLATAAVMSILLPLAHWWIAFEARGIVAGPGALLVAATGPQPFLLPAAWEDLVASHGGPSPSGAFLLPGLLFLLSSLALAAVVLPLSAAFLAREAPPGAALRVPVPRLALDRRLRALVTRGNPVAWKESLLLDTAWSRPLHYALLGLLLGAEVVVLLLLARGEWDAASDGAYLAVLAPALGALAAVQGAASLAVEKTRGSFDLLRVTRLTAREIARGKFAGILVGLGPFLLVPLAHLAVTAAFGIHSPAAAGAAAFVFLLLFVNSALHGLTWGAVARSPAAALAGAASFAVFSVLSCAVLCVLPFLLFVLRSVRRFDVTEFFEVVLVPAALSGSPLLFFWKVMEAFEESGGGAGETLGLLWVTAASSTVSFVYVLYRWHHLPAVLEAEMARLSEGVLDVGPSPPPRPRPAPGGPVEIAP
jgi:ABC-type transport system involved in multi-copper enzyme maturation permease subunit